MARRASARRAMSLLELTAVVLIIGVAIYIWDKNYRTKPADTSPSTQSL